MLSPTEIPDAPAPATQSRPATPPPLPRPAPPPATPFLAPNPAPVASQSTPPSETPTPTPGPVRPLKEELAAIGPTTTPGDVRRLAARLAAALCDPGSLGGYIAAIGKVVAGTISRDRLLAAYQAGLKSVGKAQRPGAIFQYTLANWTPPPRPSEIRYYQTRTVPVVPHPARWVRLLQHSQHPPPLLRSTVDPTPRCSHRLHPTLECRYPRHRHASIQGHRPPVLGLIYHQPRCLRRSLLLCGGHGFARAPSTPLRKLLRRTWRHLVSRSSRCTGDGLPVVPRPGKRLGGIGDLAV